MRTPIAYALGWPARIPAPSPELDLASVGTLSFEKPDAVRFPAIELARQSLRDGGAAPTVLNAANEIAVAAFLQQKIKFLDIARIVENTLGKLSGITADSLEDVISVDNEARAKAAE